MGEFGKHFKKLVWDSLKQRILDRIMIRVWDKVWGHIQWPVRRAVWIQEIGDQTKHEISYHCTDIIIHGIAKNLFRGMGHE